MEYASGGELYDYLNERKRVTEIEARSIFRQIVSAVHFLHKNRIVHRDLKLENILIDNNGDIKLADFGLSNNWSPNNLLYTFCGSPLYASPEIVNGYPYFGPEVDCWSLGVLLYTLVYGSMPFQGGDYNRLVKQITDGQFIVPRERSGAFGLIKKCLCTKAAKRASIDDIAEHWWVNVGYGNIFEVFNNGYLIR
jgi:NUAK family SNF1-like kinase